MTQSIIRSSTSTHYTEQAKEPGVEVGDNSGETDAIDGEGELVDTDTRVSEAMQRLYSRAGDIITTGLPTDALEHDCVTQFITSGCGCTKARGTECCQQFSREYITSVRQSCAELTRAELDMAILGQIAAGTNTSPMLSTGAQSTGRAHHREAERERRYTGFFHQGKPVCRTMFLFLHGIGKKRLENLAASFRDHGLSPRTHGNAKKLPHNALSFSSTQFFVKFVFNYAEQHALLLPGRVPGYSRSDIQLLPSSVSKRAIWRVYQSAAEADGTVHPVAYTTFCHLWKELTPSVLVMKPRSDLCWQCQQNSTAIMRTSNLAEAHKSAAIQNALEHLRIVRVERQNYKAICEECKVSVRAHFTTNGTFTPSPPCSRTPCNSQNIKVHYSFDYAQQVHYPSDPLQPGPIYFLTPRKCTVFGVACEALPRQIFFLTDEAGDCGKGANAVVSRIDYFFTNHGFGEKEVYLHADNCAGQNKNNCMLQYLVWRTLTNRHTNITLSFLPVGHTKFAPDWCFGLFKRSYRRTKVGSLCSIAQVVNNSAVCNFTQLVAREDGSTIVPTYNWTDFFAARMKKVTGILKFHHFRVSASSPGVVFAKERSDSAEVPFTVLKEPWTPEADEMPSVIPPHGLSANRQWYLYDYIRPFCPEDDKDSVCPLPTVPKPHASRAGTPNLDPPEDDSAPPPSKKRKRTCGICNQVGHDRRSCPDN